MEFVLSRSNIIKEHNIFIIDKSSFSGVRKIVDKVRNDLNNVFTAFPGIKEAESTEEIDAVMPIIVGTYNNSRILALLEEHGKMDLGCIKNKREVFSFQLVENIGENIPIALVIAGSDKRGTIYGLFHLSELMGVSPFTDWFDIMPEKLDSKIISSDSNMVSKEPSVKYRGFFINDEWPAFGNWTMKNYGGFTAKMYEHVFELLLRMKGNYLWPAMWSSRFSVDGPDLESAVLADELGVVMGMSHHEPCLRHGEEYKYLRGPESIYGDAWNFRSNREGIIRFWRDGLIRSGKFENVITVGMRGEADSTIMGKDATLKDNIDLLRDVLKTQNSLIRENVNPNIEEVPRMLALYKEVEPFFYGDENTEGLMNYEELEGVILMLCDDNFGNLRTLPTEEMRGHNGGYGMYYHFDYHGYPVSFEWVNSSFLPKVWEQMTTAYEFGVRDLWIVNVGDIFANEYPLAYFMDLAYDYDRWGISNINSPAEYNSEFVKRQFADRISSDSKKEIEELLRGYTKLTHRRRPEAMNDSVYKAFCCEADDILDEIYSLLARSEKLNNSLPEAEKQVYYQILGYPLKANLNLQTLWLLTGKNHELAKLQAGLSRNASEEVKKRLSLDKELVEELHLFNDGKWYGMGMSEHIGFTRWNEEECQYPVLYEFEPANKSRFTVYIPGTGVHTEGGVWTGKSPVLPNFLNPEVENAKILLYSTGKGDARYEAECDDEWINISSAKGIIKAGDKSVITIEIRRELIKQSVCGYIRIKGEYGVTNVQIPVNVMKISDIPEKTFIWCGEAELRENEYNPYQYISIEAAHYFEKSNIDEGDFCEIPDYGKTLSAMKVFPVNRNFDICNSPWIDYRVMLPEEDEFEFRFYVSPSNPVNMDNKITFGVACCEEDKKLNDILQDAVTVNVIPDGFKVNDGNMYWEKGVLDNIRIASVVLKGKKGFNRVRVYGICPGFVLQKIVICKNGYTIPESYLGPKETYVRLR